MRDLRRFYIDGGWADPAAPKDFEVENPATQETIAVISLGSEQDVDRAVAAARRAFAGWAATPVEDRAALLERALAIYRRRAEEMAQAITAEMGAPIRFSREQQAPSGEAHLVATLEALRARAFEAPSPRGGSLIAHEPIGVCGLITPWNWPINQIAAKVAPALAAGCAMVLKPSEIAPISGALFAEILDEAGCPRGVFNLVHGDGPTVGAALSRHGDIDMVSFTGSTRAGVAVSEAAAPTVKRVALELGGKSPNLVFADADLDAAADFAVDACFANAGQSCDAPTRLLVERSVYAPVLDRVARRAAETRLGDPAQDGDHLGPVVSGRHYERIRSLIRAGIDEGARLVVGGPGEPEDFAKGWYVRPTVFADVAPGMTVDREEIFGPVLAVAPFEAEADAIARANATEYGLAAYLWTSDPGRARRVSRALRAGQVSVNGAIADVDAPFGGYKRSGVGRENGAYGLAEFLEVKAITGLDAP